MSMYFHAFVDDITCSIEQETRVTTIFISFSTASMDNSVSRVAVLTVIVTVLVLS
jgi:hypothetical protein